MTGSEAEVTASTPVTGRVSVIIPVKDDPLIRQCVASVLALRDEVGELEVLVVDNGSGDGFASILWSLEGVTVLHEPKPGPYAARNTGVRSAHGEVLFFTDADCVVRPGWFRHGLAALEKADIVRGFAGSVGTGKLDRLIQQRYEAHLHSVRPGSATECDTRDLAVRREVFDRLMFNEAYRRVGDTEFGLLAEAAGFRIAYCPEMAVEHAHEPDLPLLVAKQVCHGWGAQRLMQTHPGLPWHGAHLRLAARCSRVIQHVPGRQFVALALARMAIASARLLQRTAPRLPGAVTLVALTALDKAGGLAGHLLYARGAPEPSPSGLLGRPPGRD